jgi:hypothetical protein
LNIYFAIYHQSNNAFKKTLPHIHPTFDFPKLQWMFEQPLMKQQNMFLKGTNTTIQGGSQLCLIHEMQWWSWKKYVNEENLSNHQMIP